MTTSNSRPVSRPTPAETAIKVRISREALESLVPDGYRIEWGKPDKKGFYSPTIWKRPFPITLPPADPRLMGTEYRPPMPPSIPPSVDKKGFSWRELLGIK